MNVKQLLKGKWKLLKVFCLKMQSFTILQNINCSSQETESTCGELVIFCNDHLHLFYYVVLNLRKIFETHIDYKLSPGLHVLNKYSQGYKN